MLTRKQSSIILQLRCGHFPLNNYLHRINKIDSNRCQACAEQLEGISPPETINHFIFDCPAYTVARNELLDKIGEENFFFPNIMADIIKMKALITFINRTGRFRNWVAQRPTPLNIYLFIYLFPDTRPHQARTSKRYRSKSHSQYQRANRTTTL